SLLSLLSVFTNCTPTSDSYTLSLHDALPILHFEIRSFDVALIPVEQRKWNREASVDLIVKGPATLVVGGEKANVWNRKAPLIGQVLLGQYFFLGEDQVFRAVLPGFRMNFTELFLLYVFLYFAFGEVELDDGRSAEKHSQTGLRVEVFVYNFCPVVI